MSALSAFEAYCSAPLQLVTAASTTSLSYFRSSEASAIAPPSFATAASTTYATRIALIRTPTTTRSCCG